LGAGFIPPVLDRSVIDEILTVGKEEAYAFTGRTAREEGLLVGISTGAVLAAVNRKMNALSAGSRILTFNYDTGERYLSAEGLF
ncbi:MAG: cysteine synthase A, partial [Bacteroidales bacterium]|nr:cysteine synthase A [Bacteroidales bacterium]